MKLTAVHHQRPALVPEEQTAPARCLGSLYPAQKRLRKNGLSERRRVPRGDSDGRTADRCFQWATLAGLSSRIQLKRPKHKARARPARPPIHSKECKPSRPAAAHDERRRPTERSHPTFGAQRPLGFSARSPSPHRESSQSNPKHHACSYLTATRDADRRLTRPRLTTTQRRSSPSRRWRSASRPPRSSARRRRSTATCPRA